MTFELRLGGHSPDDCERCSATGPDGQCDRCTGHPPPHRTLTKTGPVKAASWTDDQARDARTVPR